MPPSCFSKGMQRRRNGERSLHSPYVSEFFDGCLTKVSHPTDKRQFPKQINICPPKYDHPFPLSFKVLISTADLDKTQPDKSKQKIMNRFFHSDIHACLQSASFICTAACYIDHSESIPIPVQMILCFQNRADLS